MKKFIADIFSDSNGKGSSKRLAVLWTAIPIWTFVHVMAFLTNSMKEERSTLIMYDFILIVSGLGIIVHENLRSKKLEEENK